MIYLIPTEFRLIEVLNDKNETMYQYNERNTDTFFRSTSKDELKKLISKKIKEIPHIIKENDDYWEVIIEANFIRVTIKYVYRNNI